MVLSNPLLVDAQVSYGRSVELLEDRYWIHAPHTHRPFLCTIDPLVNLCPIIGCVRHF